MKLLVQARKDGYNVLYPKPTPAEFFQFAGDIRRIDNNSGNFLGKYIYSIALSSGGCIFTKHVIVQDVQREGLGNVGFSIFIPNVKKLSGVNVKTLLDELQETYCENYCPDYYLANKQEDWELFKAIANKYENSLRNLAPYEVENYQQGTGEPAFVYYSDASEMQKYFDVPFQEEYSTYKQVFFVDERLKEASENPLNAIRYNSNANLTDKIDLSIPIILKIKANDDENGDIITNYKLRRVNDPNFIQENDTELIFKNDDIHKQWYISVEHSDYDTKYFEYHPEKDHNILYVKLKIKQYLGNSDQGVYIQKGKVYRLNVDKNKGSRSTNGIRIREHVYGYPDFEVDARSGYKFVRWEKEVNPNSDTVYYNAIFEERQYKIWKWVWILLISILIAIATIFVISKLSGNSGSNESNYSSEIDQINYCIDGIELDIELLKRYKLEYCNSTLPTESNESDRSLLQKLWPFGSKDNEVHSQEPHPSSYCSRINNAILIRNAINAGRIDDLIGKTYSVQQQSFKETIISIDTNYKKQIGGMLSTQLVSDMNLDEIEDLISKELERLREEKLIRQSIIKQENKAIEQKQQQKEEQRNRNAIKQQQRALEKEFWKLVNSGNTNRDKYGNLYRVNKNIGGDIIKYLDEIYNNPKTFKKFTDIPEVIRIQANLLTQINIE